MSTIRVLWDHTEVSRGGKASARDALGRRLYTEGDLVRDCKAAGVPLRGALGIHAVLFHTAGVGRGRAPGAAYASACVLCPDEAPAALPCKPANYAWPAPYAFAPASVEGCATDFCRRLAWWTRNRPVWRCDGVLCRASLDPRFLPWALAQIDAPDMDVWAAREAVLRLRWPAGDSARAWWRRHGLSRDGSELLSDWLRALMVSIGPDDPMPVSGDAQVIARLRREAEAWDGPGAAEGAAQG